jgi:hypothetical protein
MNNVAPFPLSMMSFLVLPLIAVQIAWYVMVTVMLFKIWRKVKHLPG